jgi:hypothetical protein
MSEQTDEPTLRDAFAIAALPPIIADGLRKETAPDDIADKAYLMADAMLRRRERP